MKNFDKFVFVVLVLNCVFSAAEGAWETALAWGVASGCLFLGTTKKKDGI
jgi:hypothetical protein